jgi:hypothetical protein
MLEAVCSSLTSVLTIATQCDIPEDVILCVLVILYLWGWSGTGTPPIYWPIVPAPGDSDDNGAVTAMNKLQGKQKYSEETCSSAALSTRDPT